MDPATLSLAVGGGGMAALVGGAVILTLLDRRAQRREMENRQPFVPLPPAGHAGWGRLAAAIAATPEPVAPDVGLLDAIADAIEPAMVADHEARYEVAALAAAAALDHLAVTA